MTLHPVDNVTALSDALMRAAPADTIELAASAFGQWSLALATSGWMLTNGHRAVSFGGMSGARVRIVLNGTARLLVGDTGYSSIQSAIDAAQVGDTILIAPGTYQEGRVFTDAEPGRMAGVSGGFGLVIDKSLTLQGVLDDGTPVRDCDDVAATAVAMMQSVHGTSFAVLADDVVIQGLGFAPAGRRDDAATARGPGKVFEVLGKRFSLLASVVERSAPARAASAVHFRGTAGGGVVSGNSLHGSITLDGVGAAPAATVAIVDNDIVGDLLPPIRIGCSVRALTGPQPESLLPVLADNTLRAHGKTSFSLFIECEDAANCGALAEHSLDAYLRQVLDSHSGAGALLVDSVGHVKISSARGLGVYASAQAALDAARDGDTLYIGPGTRNGAPESAVTRELSNAEVLSMLDRTSDLATPVHLFDATGRLKQVHAGIQSAIDSAVGGDRIVVAPSHHVGDVYIRKSLTLSGANAGMSGFSARRGIETHLSGRLVIGADAGEVVIDGFTILGSVSTEPSAASPLRLSLRHCVIDGSSSRAAVSILGGSGVTLADNRIIGGADEAIYVPYGFENLAITGNSIRVAEGAVAIALNGGAGADSVNILGNTILGGDYGVLIEVDSGLEQDGDVITVAGNHFGEIEDGVIRNGPAVAAIHADRPVPVGLGRSLGVSLDLNTYYVTGAAVASDVMFEPHSVLAISNSESRAVPRGRR